MSFEREAARRIGEYILEAMPKHPGWEFSFSFNNDERTFRIRIYNPGHAKNRRPMMQRRISLRSVRRDPAFLTHSLQYLETMMERDVKDLPDDDDAHWDTQIPKE